MGRMVYAFPPRTGGRMFQRSAGDAGALLAPCTGGDGERHASAEKRDPPDLVRDPAGGFCVGYGLRLEKYLDGAVLLVLEDLVRVGRLVERQLVGGEVLDAKGVGGVDEKRHDGVGPRLDVRLAHADLYLLVEELQHVHGVGGPAVDAAYGERAPAADGLDALVERRQPVDPALLHRRLGHRVGQQADEGLGHLAPAGAVRLHADGVDDGVGAPPVCHLADGLRNVVVVAQVYRLDPVAAGHVQALWHEVHAYDPVALVPGDPRAHLADGTEAEDRHATPLRDAGVLDGLPARRQHVREVDEPLVGHPRALLGDLYGDELGLRDAQELGLPARHLAVEFGVAEKLGARAVLVDLRRLALGVEPLVAHKAVPAAYVERQDHPVAGGHIRDLRPNLLDYPHRLVAEDVPLVDERAEHVVKVQVRAADVGRRYPDYGVVRLPDARVRHVVHPNVLFPVPGKRLHAAKPPSPIRPPTHRAGIENVREASFRPPTRSRRPEAETLTLSLGAAGLIRVLALADLLDDLGAERRQVVGVAAGDEALVGDDLLVHPVAARVADVRLERRVGGQRAALDHVGLDQRPGPVADHAHRLGLLEETVHEPDHVGVGAQVVRPHGAARHDQGVVVVRGDVGHGLVDREGVPHLGVVVHRLGLAGLDADDLDGGALGLDGLLGLDELHLLRPDRRDQNSYLASLQLVCHGFSFSALRSYQGTGPLRFDTRIRVHEKRPPLAANRRGPKRLAISHQRSAFSFF